MLFLRQPPGVNQDVSALKSVITQHPALLLGKGMKKKKEHLLIKVTIPL